MMFFMRLLLLFSLVCGAWAADVNFSGTWKMNAQASDFGNLPAPTSLTRTIDHSEPKIRVQTVQSGARGEVKSDYSYTTDGKPFTQSGSNGDVKGSARWNGDTLIVQSTRQVQTIEIRQEDHWTLSKDGKVLKVATRITTPQGIVNITVGFDKQ